MKLIFSLVFALVFFACDGKPPEMVEKKIATRPLAESKPEENPNALLNDLWARNALWEAGTEERAEYDAERVIEGKLVKFRETRLTRKEAFSRQAYSATSDTTRTDLVATLSQHVLGTSESATYSASLSVLQRDPLKLAKFVAAWSDERGTSTKTVRRLVGRTMLYVHSWQADSEGKGDGEIDLAKNDFLSDQLPLALRALNFQQGREFYWSALSDLTEPASEKPVPLELHCKIESLDTLAVAAGAFRCWRVSVVSTERDETYWFSVEAPNVLVKVQTPRYAAELRRLDYRPRNAAVLNKAKL